ncbi:PREDICTED: calmodulin-binding protein 60 A isoform X2 [Tarenaya hassleriana]|nr:PREDICTED: calmodulin-binding protein 60 A isoform X2 [Tarenaya hassleriana]
MRLQTVKHLLEPVLEPLIRKVVKEEVELALGKHLTGKKWICEKETLALESRNLQLKFLTNLSLPVFTSARIEGDDSQAIRIGLIEPSTGQIVTSGPGSSAKVEIVVIEGDFDSDSHWTVEEFSNNIVREREGKKHLLNGEVFVVLNDGIGVMSEISFTDNSSWTRSRKFRLGARMVDQFDFVKVKEATTESFIVRDHRGELYRKHHPPSLFDEVWRLEKIGKDGAFHKRLDRENIKTVKDFLIQFYLNPPNLRHILGPGMSAKMWEVTVEHAQTCVLNGSVHVYCPLASQKKSGVVFNTVAQVLGMLKEFQYIPTETLTEAEKVQARGMVIAALSHPDEVIMYPDEASLMGELLQNNMVSASNSSAMATSGARNVMVASQNVDGFDYPGATMAGLDIFDLQTLQDSGPVRCSPQAPAAGQYTIEATPQALSDDYHLRYLTNSPNPQCCQSLVLEESQADLQSMLDGFMSQQPLHSDVAVEKAQRRWTKLFSVLKWLSVRKLVALRKTHPQVNSET